MTLRPGLSSKLIVVKVIVTDVGENLPSACFEKLISVSCMILVTESKATHDAQPSQTVLAALGVDTLPAWEDLGYSWLHWVVVLPAMSSCPLQL